MCAQVRRARKVQAEVDDTGDAVQRLQQELAFAHQRCVQSAAASRLIEHLTMSSLPSEAAQHVYTIDCPEHCAASA